MEQVGIAGKLTGPAAVIRVLIAPPTSLGRVKEVAATAKLSRARSARAPDSWMPFPSEKRLEPFWKPTRSMFCRDLIINQHRVISLECSELSAGRCFRPRLVCHDIAAGRTAIIL